MISELYQRELHALREKAAEFSRKYPAYAPHLGGTSSDPDVERILEGVAFLGAGIQERLDAGFPQFAQSLLNLVAPQHIEEIPSTTIMSFTPKSILKEPLTIPAGTFIDSRDVQNTKCRFATTVDTRVYPLTISDIRFATRGDQAGTLTIDFNPLAGFSRQIDVSELRFLASGDYLQASALFYLIKSCTHSISLEQGQRRDTITGCAIDSLGVDDDFRLLPHPPHVLPSYSRLTEYYVNKSKYLYFKLTAPRPEDLMVEGGRFSLVFDLRGLRGKIPRIDKDSLKLFTVPAINLFPHESEPVQVDQREAELALHPARNVDGRYQIHSVLSVNGHNRQTASRREYQPLSLLSQTDGDGGVYELVRQVDPDSGRSLTHLNLSYLDGSQIPQRETLTASLRCSNGPLAGELKQGDIHRATQNTSEMVEFQNVQTPTSYIPPKTGDELWHLLSHLTVNYLPLANIDNLKALLRLYLPQQGLSRNDDSANRKRIDSLSDVSVQPVERLIRGTLIRGQHIQLGIDGSGFAGMGDLYLFGEVMHRLLADFATINAFIELTINDLNSGEQLEWSTRPGQRSLI